jgi:hypothetical protein
LRASYLLESSVPLAQAAETIAGEQSSGTFGAVQPLGTAAQATLARPPWIERARDGSK